MQSYSPLGVRREMPEAASAAEIIKGGGKRMPPLGPGPHGTILGLAAPSLCGGEEEA